MKKIILIFLVLLIACGVYFLFLKKDPQKADKEAMLQTMDLTVEFRETGNVSPRNRLEIKPPFAGRIEEILTEEGNLVKKGQTIAWISSSERAAMIDAARSMGQEEYERWLQIYKPTPIVAPMNGFIILRSKEPGQTITAADAILVMADDLIIESNVDETDLRYIKIGDKLRISLDAYPDEFFTGTVEHIAYESTVVSNVTVYAIKIRPDKKPKVFRAGMTATITVSAESKKGALAIPNTFITDRNGKKTVMIATGKKGKDAFLQRPVTTGMSDGKFTEILSGLKQDEKVVTLKTQSKEKPKSFMSRK